MEVLRLGIIVDAWQATIGTQHNSDAG